MATGFTQRFQGKIKAAQLWLGTGGVFDAVSGVKGLNDFVMKIPLPVTATANTDFTTTLPAGGTLLNASVYTTVAYTGATVALTMGTSAGDNSIVTTVSIKAVGLVPLTLIQAAAAAPGIMPATSPNLFWRLAQGTPTAVGTAFLILNYTAQ